MFNVQQDKEKIASFRSLLGAGQLFIILLCVTNYLPMVSHTLCQVLQVLLILSPVNELLHQLNAPLCPIINCQELPDKVSGLNIGRDTWPEGYWDSEPGDIFNLEKVEQKVRLG